MALKRFLVTIGDSTRPLNPLPEPVTEQVVQVVYIAHRTQMFGL